MKNILVLIHDDAGQEARFQAALDVTRAIRGHLTCLDVTMMQLMPSDPLEAAGVMMLESERQRESVNKAHLESRLRVEDVSWDWIDVTGFLESSIEEALTLCDLVVVNRRLDAFPYPDMGHVAAGLVVKSGRPVLAVPDSVRGFNAAGMALIAWDGSPAASAALGAAVPLLRLAKGVTIVEVDDGSVKAAAEEAATYLSRHDIHPRIVRVAPFGKEGDTASDILLARAGNGTFDYMVMGGFSHSRFVEAVLGGVTRRMLNVCPIPLFLAH
jgi:nucleotide-binding universal stress UspA family protein